MEALQRRGLRFHLAALTLARTGIIVIRAAASEAAVRTLARMAETTWEQVSRLPPGESLPSAYLNRDQERVLRGYKALVESEKPVVNFRHGDDDGMMDIFHPENLIPEARSTILEALHEDLVKGLAKRAFMKKFQVTCRNLYVNHGVENTRFYHCDGESVKVKTFVYITDVDSLEIGPYCYVKHSHRSKSLRRRNQAFNQQHGFNKHEYRLMGSQTSLPIFAKAGDMVVSAQHGAHRGHPQAPSARRTVLVNVMGPRRAEG
ncbi:MULTISPECIES: hypothetical protein [Aphanothece]|uniref:hypothetical protein n=1 Tax=Aphanothece TaxID=1121 RepID=UPI00398F3B72